LIISKAKGGCMDVSMAIHDRQSITDVRPDPVPREMVEKLLAAAVQAPNHYKVRPWRFIVLSGDGLARLGKVIAESFATKFPQAPVEAIEKESKKPLRAPLVIAVGVDQPGESKVLEIENICAAAAAVENLLLEAHALGLAAKWRTGEEARDPRVKEFLGLSPDQHLIAFIYIGYPMNTFEPIKRPGFEDRTTWFD
jgi:nitroreductase